MAAVPDPKKLQNTTSEGIASAALAAILLPVHILNRLEGRENDHIIFSKLEIYRKIMLYFR
jgi:hypothetical protein